MIPRRWLLLAVCLTAGSGFAASEPPVIPVGLDAYRMWDRWAQQRVGARAYMRSTYDRRGGNESADASHYLYQESKAFNVSLDVQGPGILYFARYNHWHGSPWHYEVDGVDHIVQESSSANPLQPVPDSIFMPAPLFPNPLTWTWSITKGADLMWVPIPFEKSFRMAYTRTRYGTGYYIFHQYVRGANLSQPIRAWDAKTPPGRDVLELIRRAGTDIAPRPHTMEGTALGVVQESGTIDLSANGRAPIVNISKAPSMLRAIEFTVPISNAVSFSRAMLRVTWDGRNAASIDAPVGLFFGAGTFYNRDGREYLVKAFPVFVRYESDHVHMACFFPMPFFKSARVELIGNGSNAIPAVQWSVRHHPFNEPANHVGYFHATYRDHPTPKPGHDLVLLDTRTAEGGGDWTGSFVGTSFIFSHRNYLGTLEGDPRFFFDDSLTPQAYGTGTEEWGGGGDYWGGRNMTLPFAGHPVGARDIKEAQNAEDQIHSAYRFLLADLMPFGKNAVIRLEHGGQNESTEHYKTVTYWYGLPGASLVKTDELKIGDVASEQSHSYHSPDASAPYEINSRYEWGVDTIRRGSERPQANPSDFAEFEFDADAATYTIWVRGRNLDGNNMSDAFWMQFNDEIGTTRLGAGHTHPKAFGNWLDQFPAGQFAWSSALPQDPPQTVTFPKAGRQKLRIHARHPRHQVDQIWLSTTQKTLPPRQHTVGAITDSRTQILLSAQNATRLTGAVRTVNEPMSSTGKVIDVGGSTDVVVYPPHKDTARKTQGSSEFTVKLNPTNFGALLRRKLDYSFPNQRAEVFVADPRKAELAESDWKPAGIWYLAGANTCVYSDPKGELGETLHIVQTSNRRFRDDEFLVPRELTQGRDAIRVRVRFTPVNRPLFPGHPLPELAWSEIRYDVYSIVMPPEPR